VEFPEGIWCDFRTGVHQDSGPRVQRRAAGLPGRRACRDHLSCRGRCGAVTVSVGPGRGRFKPHVRDILVQIQLGDPLRLILRDSRTVQDWQWDEVYTLLLHKISA
jgi:hypothetical protein